MSNVVTATKKVDVYIGYDLYDKTYAIAFNDEFITLSRRELKQLGALVDNALKQGKKENK